MHPRAIPPSQAVRSINTCRRLGFSSDDSDDDLHENLEREIWFLRSIVTFHDACSTYPFVTAEASKDFCKNWVDMTIGDYLKEINKMRKKYEQRMKKKSQDLVPREQEALEIGNMIWGSISAKEKEEEEHKDELLDRFPLLKQTFKFGASISDDVVVLGSEKMKERNNEWKRMQVKELEIFLKRIDMIRNKTLHLLDRTKSE